LLIFLFQKTLLYIIEEKELRYGASIIFLISLIFFVFSVYFLPIKFQTNDDVAMCQIASGASTGTPETRLIFINIIYGIVLSFFYKIFSGIEWYTVFFSIIHIVSLSIIVYTFLRTKKSILIKKVSVILLYVLEFTIIQNLQFTTTAAIAALAGTILLFKKKNIYIIIGIILFLIGTLIRFHSGMLVMLLMLPCFFYEYFLKEKNIRIIISVAICICIAFIFQLIDKQAYKVKEWSYYNEYNAVRGYLLGNPNKYKIINDLPSDISINQYRLFLTHFIDGKYIDLKKINELKHLVKNIPQPAKYKNIFPFINNFSFILYLIAISFAVLFSSVDKKNKIFILSYAVFLLIIFLIISSDGIISHRVFIAMFFPIIFFLYGNSSIYPREKNLINIYVFILISFIFTFLYNIYNTKKIDYSTTINEQMLMLEKVKSDKLKTVSFGASLRIELICDPFQVYEYFNDIPLVGSGWFTNIPYNKGYFDSYLSLPEKNIHLFIANNYIPEIIPLIQNVLIENYNCETDILITTETDNYSLIKFIKK